VAEVPPAIQRPAAGTPTPEAVDRLRQLARRAAEVRPPESREPQRPAPTPAPAGDKGRFGINSLINRMTGQPGEGGAGAPAQRAQARPSYEAQQPDAEQERADIPAFLRRQAN
jgi:cell division protein FtsZ